MKAAAPIAIGLGFVLMLASAAWPSLFPATRTWTDEKSMRQKELVGKVQFLGGKLQSANQKPNMTGGENPAVMKEKFESMQQELKELESEFSNATEGPKTMSTVLKWSGVGIMALGVVGHLVTKEA